MVINLTDYKTNYSSSDGGQSHWLQDKLLLKLTLSSDGGQSHWLQEKLLQDKLLLKLTLSSDGGQSHWLQDKLLLKLTLSSDDGQSHWSYLSSDDCQSQDKTNYSSSSP